MRVKPTARGIAIHDSRFTIHESPRTAFTLVEMLVAMALIMFIMVILSQSFVTGLEAFRQLKGIGDMQENLRVASSRLRADLAEDHFEGKRKLSDPSLLTERPREGFFYLQIGPNRGAVNPNTTEGFDADGMPSYRGPLPGQASDSLYFTVKLRGNRRENFMSHRLPSNPNPVDFTKSPLVSVTNPPNFFNQPVDGLFQDDPAGLRFNSQWAEVAWYIVKTGSTAEPSIPTSTLGQPLYALYRDQYVLVPNNDPANGATNGTTANGVINAYAGVSCFPRPAPGTTIYFNSPADVVNSAKRCRIVRPGLINETLVLTNVISFQVRLMQPGGTDFNGDYWSMDPPGVTPPYKSFDTASSSYQIRALQILIRIWDPASQQTRQITMVQDM